MSYDEIKAELANARALLDAGDVADADALLRSLLSRGMTLHDLDNGLTAGQFAQLREHAKRGAT